MLIQGITYTINVTLKRELKRNNIDLISHSQKTFVIIKSIGWISDFQHFHLPEMFWVIGRWKRTRTYKNLLDVHVMFL